jgi:hypothetical protein
MKAIKRPPASLHKYAYASLDPINRVDPNGQADIASILSSISLYGALAELHPLGGGALTKCQVVEELKVRITPPREILGQSASILHESAVWDGEDARLWFTMKAKFANGSCDFRQMVRGRHVVNGQVLSVNTGAGLPLSPTENRDDGYGRDQEPEAYKTQPDGTVLLSTYDNPGEGSFKSLNLSLDFQADIIDKSPGSPRYGKTVGISKLYGFRVSGAAPNAKFTTIYGFSNAKEYAPK